MTTGIYKIENRVNGKIYIGQSTHIEKRWAEHCKASSNSLISQAIQKYGKENFNFQILEEIKDLKLLNQIEAKYIRSFNSLVPNGYNIVLADNQEHHQFSKYDQITFLEIINQIKNTNLSFKEIAQNYDLDISMIYYLNRGDYHTLPYETYPLRPVQDFSKKQHFCLDCGIEITKGAIRCSKCDHIKQQRCDRPSREDLKKLIRTKSFLFIARQFGVSDNSIRKWFKNENLPYKKSEIKQYSDEEWEKI